MLQIIKSMYFLNQKLIDLTKIDNINITNDNIKSIIYYIIDYIINFV